MDYCHPCQRHLNGALACAGCGTPAEALSHYAAPAPLGHEPDARDEAAAPSRPGGRRRRGHDAARTERVAAPAGHGGHGSGRPRRGEERDARPRRGRRARSRRGRTVLLALLGVALAAGALSLAELATEPDGGDGASDYVRESASVTTAPAPEPPASDAVEPPGPVETPAGSPPVVLTTDAHPSSAPRTDRPRPEATTAPAPAATAEVSGPPSEQPATPSAGPSEPDGTGDEPSRPPASEPPTPTPTPPPTPTPSPSDTCWFLWFC